MAWRKLCRLVCWDPKPPVFLAKDGQNYLIKMQQDAAFLGKLPFCSKLQLQAKDPLLGGEGLTKSLAKLQRMCSSMLEDERRNEKSPKKRGHKGRLRDLDNIIERNRTETRVGPKRVFLQESEL
jgi:hypothetical protein